MSDQWKHDSGHQQTWPSGSRIRPLEVAVDDRGIEPALRVFKRLMLRDGVLREMKRRQYYEKPGVRRRRKAREAARRRYRQLARARRRMEELTQTQFGIL